MAQNNNSVMSVEGLRRLEDLLKEVGTEQSAVHAQSKPPKPRATSASQHGRVKDCLSTGLAKDHSGATLSPISMISTRRSPSAMRGIVMAGKQDTSSMYLGKGFEGPGRESPGPMYQPMSTLDTTHGVSFPKSSRMTPSQHRSVSAGPDIALPSTLGRQNLSQFASPANVPFNKGKRFNAREFISRAHGTPPVDTPSPCAYQSLATTNEKKGMSIGMAKTVASNKLFISRKHTADCLGLDSPGPMYNVEEAYADKCREMHKPAPVFVAHKPHYTTGPSFSFGGKRPMLDESASEVSMAMPVSTTPGPGEYSANFSQTEPRGPSISIPKDRSRSRARSATPAGVSAPVLNPDKTALDKHVSAVSFGNHLDRYNRFNDNIYLGNGIDTGKGAASPGPKYALPSTIEHRAITIAFKEKTIKHKLEPGPDRARFVSKSLARENLGAYSPGPKYLPGPHPGWKSSPSVSFGVSDRYFVDTNFTAEHRAKFGTAEKPYTSPGEARFVSLAHSRSAMSGMTSPGPRGSPSIEVCSQVKRAPCAVIAPPEKVNPRAASPPSKTRPTLYYPSYSHIDMDEHVHSFGKGPRQQGGKASGLPGPGQYNPKYTQVETRPADVSIGIL